MNSKEFVLGLILEDERRRTKGSRRTVPPGELQGKDDKVIILQEQDFTIDSTYRVQGQDDQDNVYESPFRFEGFLDTFVFKSNSNNFNATVEVDEFDVLNRQAFTDIQDISIELSHVGAFESNGSYVLSVSSYPFSERLYIQIEPLETITVELVRTEIFRGVRSPPGAELDPELGDLVGDI